MIIGGFRDSYFLDPASFRAGVEKMLKAARELAMAIDRNKERLKVGDVVHVPCRIVNIGNSEKHHNLLVETVDPLFPTNQPAQFSLNGRQCLKQSRKTQIQPAPAPAVEPPAKQEPPQKESHGSDQPSPDAADTAKPA